MKTKNTKRTRSEPTRVLKVTESAYKALVEIRMAEARKTGIAPSFVQLVSRLATEAARKQ